MSTTTVFQAQNLPVGGTLNAIGPVTVSMKYPPKMTAKGTMMLNAELSDGSGSIGITLWEPASKLAIADGGVYTFEGLMKREEYQGKPKLSSTSLRIAGQGGNPTAASVGQQASQGGSQAAQGAAPGIAPKDMQIMRQNALSHATALVVAVGVKDIFHAQEDVLELARRFAKYSATGSTEALPSKDELAAQRAAKAKTEAEAAAKALQDAADAAVAAAAAAPENPNNFPDDEPTW